MLVTCLYTFLLGYIFSQARCKSSHDHLPVLTSLLDLKLFINKYVTLALVSHCCWNMHVFMFLLILQNLHLETRMFPSSSSGSIIKLVLAHLMLNITCPPGGQNWKRQYGKSNLSRLSDSGIYTETGLNHICAHPTSMSAKQMQKSRASSLTNTTARKVW